MVCLLHCKDIHMRHLFYILPVFLSFFAVIIANGSDADFKFEITDNDALNLFEDTSEDFVCELNITAKKVYINSHDSLKRCTYSTDRIKPIPFKDVETPPPE